uniref:uncharacterized protein LOC105350040 n=1 Tax=Fragaria vesca subsp. vesca TaxID=101020 RepID=UPI0005CA5044|nr:PREDICTED: uncharacterized protein LOC105350040 [Fragaria vesca subsp. vesca]
MTDRKKKEEEKEKERQNIKLGNGCSSWQTPPEDVMEKIIRFVEFADQRRLGQFSKSWRSVVYQTFMRRARHQLPWLILSESPNCRVNKYVSFLTFPENKLCKGKVLKLKLPKQLQRGWIYGSSKGWLIIVKEKGLDSEMCVLNPISGILHKLPPLRTVPSFRKFIKTRRWELLGAEGFCLCIKMSSTSNDFNSSSDFIVAAVLDDRKILGLCRPGDKKWSVFLISNFIIDILFSSGMLYALVRSKQNDEGVAPTRTLNIPLYGAEHLKLKVVFDKVFDKVELPTRTLNFSKATCWSMLLESTSKEVMLIHQITGYAMKRINDGDKQINENGDNHDLNVEGDIDGVEGNTDDEGGGGDGDNEVVHENTRDVRYCTRSFRTYNIDAENNNFHMMHFLGNQIIFCGNDGAFSLPASNIKELGNNCVYYAMNLGWEVDLPKTYISDEFGIFYLDGQNTERPFECMKISIKCLGSWFTPTL